MTEQYEPTIALQGLSGFGWIDPFMQFPSLVRLPLLTTVSLVLVLVPHLLGAELQTSIALLFLIAMTGMLLSILVILARGLQSDLHGTGQAGQLELSTDRRVTHQSVSLLAGVGVFALFLYLFPNDLPWYQLYTPSGIDAVGFGQALNAWVSFAIVFYSGFLWGHLCSFVLRSSEVVGRWAGTTPIQLLDLEKYQLVTLQPMRYLLVVMLMLSVAIVSFLVLRSTLPEENLTEFLSSLLLGFFIMGLWILRPILIIRDRIRDAKEAELELIQQALMGQRDVLARSQISHMQDEFRGPDLLAYEQRIRSIWEWPVQGFVQRILLYVLLPPLAWVLAALVERLLDSVL